MNSLTASASERLRPTGLVYLAKAMQTQQDVRRWIRALRHWQPPRALLRVHLEHNFLNEHDAAEVLQSIGGSVQAVYLHHNNMRSLQPLAAFIDKNSDTLQELHLSHNRLSTAETRALLLQLGSARPSDIGIEVSKVCSWLRLEFNHIDVDELLKHLPADIKRRLQLQNNECTPTRCYCRGRRHNRRIHAKLLAMQHAAVPSEQQPEHHHPHAELPVPEDPRPPDSKNPKEGLQRSE